MVTFVTLFLSLVTGVHTVELAVGGPVDRVELLLDERVVGRLDGPPWEVVCDFGDPIEPHQLVAVAYGPDGAEIHRASQVINLPRPLAEVRVAFETNHSGMPAAARLIWENAGDTDPLSLFALFDGEILRPDGSGRYPLPTYDPTQVHIVSAEARFSDNITARSDVTFGGRYGSWINTELTAVPIVVDDSPPAEEALEKVLRLDGRPVRVAALEQPRWQVFVVRDHASLLRMSHLRKRQDRMNVKPVTQINEFSSADARPDEDRLHMVVPNPHRRNDRLLYPTSRGIGLRQWPLTWLATRLTGDAAAIVGQKMADAVAVAGVRAAADGTPRAVLAIVTENLRDESGFSIGEVRRYLSSLRVPLYVWSAGDPVPAGWGPSVDVMSHRSLNRAARRLMRDLDDQWIVWIEGNHMINEIELEPGLDGVRLAGVD